MYKNFSDLLNICENENVPLWVPIIRNECKLKDITENDIKNAFRKRLDIMRKSSSKALELPQKTAGNLISGIASKQWNYANSGKTICGSSINRIMAYALSSIEINASMGRICAAPTAGSCGILPAVLFGLDDKLSLTDDELIYALITSSGLGAIVTANATVAGAEGGCQAECGTAAAISSASAVQLMGGTPKQSEQAFSISLLNILGLVCDPIAGLVQIPCAQRNASQSVNALISADLALGGMSVPVSADEVIDAMYKIGKAMPPSLRETAEGGIAASPSARKIAHNIFEK